MIDIYTEKKDSKDWILQNDLYFNLNTSNEEMSQYEINLIRQVDEAKLTDSVRCSARHRYLRRYRRRQPGGIPPSPGCADLPAP